MKHGTSLAEEFIEAAEEPSSSFLARVEEATSEYVQSESDEWTPSVFAQSLADAESPSRKVEHYAFA